MVELLIEMLQAIYLLFTKTFKEVMIGDSWLLVILFNLEYKIMIKIF